MTRSQPLLTIFVPTMTARAAVFKTMMAELNRQVDALEHPEDVEILTDLDNGEVSIGAKRNRLLIRAAGDFVVSIDDDDKIHPRYLDLITAALRDHSDVDCVGMRGEIIFACGTSQKFVCSNAYTEYWTRDGVLTRPPHHFNPVRRSIALAFPFEDVRAHEDADVAMRMVRAGVLKREVMIDEPLYTYQTRRNLTAHRWLERTEFLRHPLGIKTVNLLRLKRWWRDRTGGDRRITVTR